MAIAASTNPLLLPTKIKCKSFYKLTIATKPNFGFRQLFKCNFTLNCPTICKVCCFQLKLLGQRSKNATVIYSGTQAL